MDEDEYKLSWRPVSDKKELAALSQFDCAEPWPTSPRGRRLPAHPRIWEHDAQRHVKNMRQNAKGDDRVLVGFDTTEQPPVQAAVVHLRFRLNGKNLAVILETGAVALSYRRKEPPFLGDEIMAVAEAEAHTVMAERDCSGLALVGHIHTGNNASMRMASRNQWEALEPPPRNGGYVRWGRALS